MLAVHLLTIFLAAILTHNIALTYLLGMCPFVSLGRSLKTAFGMGVAVIFVVVLTASVNWPIYQLLKATNTTVIQYIVFIIVIAASVQLVEMLMERFFPPLQAAFGIFLPLITVNCTVLAVSLFMVLRNSRFNSCVSGLKNGTIDALGHAQRFRIDVGRSIG